MKKGSLNAKRREESCIPYNRRFGALVGLYCSQSQFPGTSNLLISFCQVHFIEGTIIMRHLLIDRSNCTV